MVKNLYIVIIGLACCISCDTDNPKKGQQKAPEALKPRQLPTTQQDRISCYAAKDDDIAGAQQAVIKALKWGHVIIQMPDGSLRDTTKYKDWVLTPQDCKIWDYKKFGKTTTDKDEITHLYPKKRKQGTGVLPYAINGLLNGVLPSKKIVVIVSTGVYEALGISQEAKNRLEELQKKGKIGTYHILNSQAVPAQHNKCVKAGYQVYTLLHTTC